jgi:Tfp pilus assembly protein PilZ
MDLPSGTTVQVETARWVYIGRVVNLSRGGAFIETDKIHFIGEELRLRFSLPFVDASVEVVGVVRHPYASRDDGEGVGVQFIGLPVETAELFQGCIDALRGR